MADSADRAAAAAAAGAGAPLLEIRDLRKAFGATAALAGASLEIRAGEVHALVGENGAGKSTLIKAVAGALRPDSGTMRWLGQPHHPASPAVALAAGIATCHQELAIAPHLTVAENIFLGSEPSRAGWVRTGAARRRAAEILAALDQSRIAPDCQAGSLPLSARQLVEIARAVASRARLIILDEPTSSLTQHDAESLFALVRRLRDTGVSFLYVSHFLEEIVRVCDRYTVMSDGRTVACGRVADTTVEGLVGLMVGRRLDELYPRVAHEPAGALLEVEGLHGPAGKPDGVSLTVRAGEIVG